MLYSSYGTDSNITGKLTISGDLQNKNKVFNTYSSPSLGNGVQNPDTGIKDYFVTLSNPLAETIVLDTATIKQATVDEPPAGLVYNEYGNYPVKLLVTLPEITTGIIVNFIKNNVLSVVSFTTTTTTSKIIRYGTEYQTIQLLSFYNTSIQLIGLSNNKWVVNDLSLPPQISNPVGSIITMSCSTIPTGYLECNGSLCYKLNYPDLYAVIGNTYGQLNNYFKVPNFNNGSFLRGYKSNITNNLGVQQPDNIRTHSHPSNYYVRQQGGSGYAVLSHTLGTGGTNGTTTVDSSNNAAGIPDETRPMNFAVYYCIKY